MHVEKASPSQQFQSVFQSYTYCSLSEQNTSKNTGILIDDGLIEFSFIKEKDFALESNGQRMKLPQVFSVGKLEKPIRHITNTTMTYFSIKVQPWCASFFFTNGMHPIIDIANTLYPKITEVHRQLFSTNDFNEQIQCVEHFFSTKPMPDPSETEISRAICNSIYNSNGVLNIKDLLASFPHSRQKLNKLFLHQTKNSIKEFARYTRLRAIMTYHMNHPQVSLTDITYKFGYFDQSHFIKDMKKATGVSPSEFSKSNNLFYEQIKNMT